MKSIRVALLAALNIVLIAQFVCNLAQAREVTAILYDVADGHSPSQAKIVVGSTSLSLAGVDFSDQETTYVAVEEITSLVYVEGSTTITEISAPTTITETIMENAFAIVAGAALVDDDEKTRTETKLCQIEPVGWYYEAACYVTVPVGEGTGETTELVTWTGSDVPVGTLVADVPNAAVGREPGFIWLLSVVAFIYLNI
ncbi:hypothetical protein R3P38DRAFT_3103464 [Favolaschia claudopus]|uniref:Uncharacterized protein n=1 Tax=Favolaschia claudopus TaxID=2862362 RepID=A0AAV9ZKZ7_9AGAR